METGRKQIRVLYPEIKPAINRCMGKFPRIRPTAQCTTPGFMVEILITITDHLGLEIIPFTADPEDIKNGLYPGAVVGNNSTGLLSYIIDDRVDTIAIPFHDYGSSRSRFDLSAPIYNTTASFFYRKQLHRGNSWFEFFKVYSKSVWLSLGLLLLVVIIFLHVAKCLELKLNRKCKPDLTQRFKYHCQIAWYALQFMLGHAQYGKFKSSAVNVGLLILSCCYGFVILGIYGSWILSLKLNPVILTPIKDMHSLAHLIRIKEYHMIATPTKALDFTLLKRANLNILRTISESLEHNPIHLTTNNSEIVEHLAKDRSIVYTEADSQLYLDLQTHCGIAELSEHISNLPAVFVFQKGSPFLEPFNEVIKKRRDLFQKINNRYLGLDYDEINEKLCGRDKDAERLPYFGLCISLLGMCSIGILVLVIENLIYYTMNMTRFTENSQTDFGEDFMNAQKIGSFGFKKLVRRRGSSVI